jgi:antitoxin component of MazEF toxin-antitoxin module
MPSASYAIVTESLESLVGEIFARGIVKIGLQKVGADPETTTPEEMKRAIDTHITEAVKQFLGNEKAMIWTMKAKESLDKRSARNAGA